MTAATTLDETLLVELEAEFKQPPTCTFRWKLVDADVCGAQARWIMTALCCGHVGYLCEAHRERVRHLRRNTTNCPGCGRLIEVGELENSYMIEPLSA
jgi:hypothetical protein